jgi:hypothetical protein
MSIYRHFHNFDGLSQNQAREKEQVSDAGNKQHTEFIPAAHKPPLGLFKKVSTPFARQALAVYSPRP